MNYGHDPLQTLSIWQHPIAAESVKIVLWLWDMKTQAYLCIAVIRVPKATAAWVDHVLGQLEEQHFKKLWDKQKQIVTHRTMTYKQVMKTYLNR